MKFFTTDANGLIQTSPTRPTIRNKPPETVRVSKLRAAARTGNYSARAETLAFTTRPQFLPADLAPAPSSGPADNLLLSTAAAGDLTIEIEIPPANEYTVVNGDWIYLLLDTTVLDFTKAIKIVELDPTVHKPGDKIPGVIPNALLTEGPHIIVFAITDSFGNNAELSPLVPFKVDRTAPGGKFGFSPPSFGVLENEIQEHGITATLLDANGGVLSANVGGYQGIDLDDSLVPYVDDKPGTPVLIDPTKATTVDFTYDKAQITAAGDGLKKFQYQITDRAGNVGAMSLYREFETLLSGVITTLTKPIVAAMADSVISQEEAKSGVNVTIPANTQVVSGLWVVVTWGGIELAPSKIITTNNDQDVLVTPPQVFQQSSGNFDVNYEIYKEVTDSSGNPMLMLMGASPPTPVVVDLSIPGTVDPDPTTPWNEDLGLPIVKGGSSNQDNVLTVADSTVNATITIPWFTNTTPPEDAYKVDDIISVYWGGTPPEGSPIGTPINASIQVKAVDIINKKDFILTVTVAEHQAIKGAVTVTYRGSRPITGGFNHTSSPYQTVTVETLPALPGGPGGLPQVKWTEVREFAVFPGEYGLDKKGSFDGSVIEIPFYENKTLNDKIEYTYIAQSGGFISEPDGNEYSQTKLTGTYEVPAEEVNSSSFITLPNTGFFQVVAATIEASIGIRGSGKIDYTVTPEATPTVATPAPSTKVNLDTRLSSK